MKQAARGQREKLDNHLPPGKALKVALAVEGPSVYDFCCFGLDGSGRLSDDRYMVFFNQLRSPKGEVVLAQSPGRADFAVDLRALPAGIEKLVFTVNVDGAGSMSDLKSLVLNVADSLSLSITGADFSGEKAVIALEVYKKDVWRAAFVMAGFREGLPALLRLYGGEEAAPAKPAASPPPPPAPPKQAAPPPPASPPKPPKLEKITLAKGQKIVLDKGAAQTVVVENGWTAKNKDYDLKALVRYRDGKTIYVGAANADESLSTPEGAVRHGGDVRLPGEMEKILVKWHPDVASVAVSSYSALENGTGSFREYGVFVRITNGHQVVEIPAARASAKYNSYTMCFGEILFGQTPGELEVVNLEMYSKPSSEKRIGYKGAKVVMDIGPEGQIK